MSDSSLKEQLEKWKVKVGVETVKGDNFSTNNYLNKDIVNPEKKIDGLKIEVKIEF